MYILSTNRKHDCALVPLKHLLRDFPKLSVNCWFFQNFELNGSFNFCEDYQTVTKKTFEEPKGLKISLDAFQRFLNSDSQIINGTLLGIDSLDESMPLLAIDCFDASEWIVATLSQELKEKLLSNGWQYSEYFPRSFGFSNWIEFFKKHNPGVTFE